TYWFSSKNCSDPVIKAYAGWYDMTFYCDDSGIGLTNRLRLIYEDETTLRMGDLYFEFEDKENAKMKRHFSDGQEFNGSLHIKHENELEMEVTTSEQGELIEVCNIEGER
ncbi:MAG: hypothetical protein WEC59_07070, partial [Salibacteraceae bacterium]